MTQRTVLQERLERTYYINSQRFQAHRRLKKLSLRQCAAKLSEHTINPVSRMRLHRAEQMHEFGVDDDVWQAIRMVLNV